MVRSPVKGSPPALVAVTVSEQMRPALQMSCDVIASEMSAGGGGGGGVSATGVSAGAGLSTATGASSLPRRFT